MIEPEKLFKILTVYAESQGMELNASEEMTRELIDGLLKNAERYEYRSCPCRLSSGVLEQDKDIICPCLYRDPDVAEFGSCYCALYVSAEWNQGKVPHVYVPERRPPEKRTK